MTKKSIYNYFDDVENIDSEPKEIIEVDEKDDGECVSVLGVLNKRYLRPYNSIGYNNDACQGKATEEDLEK